MRKTYVGILGIFAVLTSALLADSEVKQQAPLNVILIGWDGAGRDNIKAYMDAGKLPNLKQIASEGSIVAIDILRKTDTKAGWTQILTGYEPEVTGVFSNDRYRPIPKGYTVFERLEQFFGPDKFVTVAVVGKRKHVDADGPSRKKLSKEELKKIEDSKKALESKKEIVEDPPPEVPIEYEGGVAYRKEPGKPYFHTKKSLDVWINGLMKDKAVGEKALACLEQYKDRPFFFFVHFAQVDHVGHKFGEDSPQQRAAYVSADTWTGKIVDKLKELKIYDRTLIYVTADHGFDKGQKLHKDAPYVFLATNDKLVMRRGRREDIAPTILERFGLDLGKIDPPLDGHSLIHDYTPPRW
jgi:predicted AlkP superfamily pyrophosphatase or phosphodiesterase